VGAQAAPLRVVLDTNVVVSVLVFRGGRLGALRSAWQRRAILPLVDAATVAELVRALAYPKFRLGEPEIHALLGEYLPWTETVAPGRAVRGLPRCKDPDDQKFLELAARGRADLLVTGDAALLRLVGATQFEIAEPSTLLVRLNP
jgi:putative PIN family toxin of toxin-antitoxin system